jgi:RHS repeat-associated protein
MLMLHRLAIPSLILVTFTSGATAQLVLPTTDARTVDDLEVAIAAPGPGSIAFGNGESVGGFGGNLSILHPSSGSLTLKRGMSVGLFRAYNSANVRYRQDGAKAYLGGKSWVGLGWKMHLGRYFAKSKWDASQGKYVDENWWEFPDGSQVQVSPTRTVAHPSIIVTEGRYCEESDPLPCNPNLEDCEHERCLRWRYDAVAKFPGSVRYDLQRLVDNDRDPTTNFIKNFDRNGYYVTSGPGFSVSYHSNSAFPEAISTVTVTGYSDMTITTSLCTAGDVGTGLPCVTSSVGMVKSVETTAFQGASSAEGGPVGRSAPQKTVYSFSYDETSVTDLGAPTYVARLVSVEAKGVDGGVPTADKPTTSYTYGAPPKTGVAAGTNPALLTRITYPLGMVSEYTYSAQVLGHRRVSGVTTDRTTLVAANRISYPDGLDANGTATGKTRAAWSMTRSYSIPNCDGMESTATRQLVAVGPDGQRSVTMFAGHPCGIEDVAHDWGGYGLPIREAIQSPTAGHVDVRSVSYAYDRAAAVAGHRVVRPLVSSLTTSFDDDFGACFGAGAAGATPKTTTTEFRYRDGDDYWHLSTTSSDYLKVLNGQPVRRNEYSRVLPSSSWGTCGPTNNLIGLASELVLEEAGKAVEFSFLRNCDGEITESRARNEYVERTIDPSAAESAIAPNEIDDGNDLISTATYTNQQVTSTTLSGADYSTEYTGTFSWDRNLRVSASDGTNSSSSSADPGGAFRWFDDAGGLRTFYDYDGLGRPTMTVPPSPETATRYAYPNLMTSRVIRSSGSETAFAPTDPTQLFQETTVDASGRAVRAVSARPDDALQLVIQRFDPYGRLVFKSEPMKEQTYQDNSLVPKISWDGWDSDGAPGLDVHVTGIPTKDGRPWGTTYFYGTPNGAGTNPLDISPDPLGRLRRVVYADGSAVDAEYCGPHVRNTTYGIATSLDGATTVNSQTTSYFDGFGRLVLVDAPAVSADAVYDYDTLGALTKVNLVTQLPAGPLDLWRTGGISDGQVRTFEYDAAGRLLRSVTPEGGTQKNLKFDAAGNVHESTDERSRTVAQYDGAGRLTQIRRYLDPEVSRPGTFNDRLQDKGEFAGSVPTETVPNWEEGTLNLSNKTFAAASTPWKIVSYGGCIPDLATSRVSRALYFGSDCSYNSAPAGWFAVRTSAESVSRADALTLAILRDVRDGIADVDKLEVFVTPKVDSNSIANRRLVLRLDALQVSYGKWQELPAIPLADLYTLAEWPPDQSRDFWIYIAFNKGNASESVLGRGIVIDDVKIGVQSKKSLELVYDTDVCAEPALGVAASTCSGSGTNRSAGKLVAVYGYENAGRVGELSPLEPDWTSSKVFFVYKGLNGRPSAENRQIDWRGQAEYRSWVTSYDYDILGQRIQRIGPRPPDEATSYGYAYDYRHGGLVGLRDEATATPFLSSVSGSPAIVYGESGGVAELRFANGARSTFDVDVLGRVSEARAYGAASVLLWSSGLFARDGGGNIVGMGAQRFAYDAAGRLTAARVEPQATNTPAGAHYDIAYAYDAFGNMTARTGVGVGATIPAGFDFSRSFGGTPAANRNQVVGPGAWEYDEAGNVVRQPGTYIPGGMTNVWDASSRIVAVFNGNPADPTFDARVAPAERYLYGADGLRMVTLQDGTDGKAVISLRDTDGKVVSEWEEVPGAAAPKKTKDYVWALGQQLVERTYVTAAPSVNAVSPFGSASGYGFQASSSEPAASYLADIRTDGGYRQAVSGIVPNGTGGFWLPESAFLANATNYIRIRAEGVDGAAYSAPVTFSHDPNVNGSSASQVKAVAISRVGTNVVVRWMLNQDNQKKFRIWYRRIDSGALILISPSAGLAASTREFSIPSQGLQSNCGSLGVTQINTGGTETNSLEADLPGAGINDVGDNDPCEEPPIPPNPPTTIVVNVYHHRDHLGSTRVVSDAAGWSTERYDYFPYGRQMVTDGSSEGGQTTFRYTGHERRAYVGQDYMFVRVKATNEVMFASPDPIVDASADSPTSWNRYGYSGSSPVQRMDPLGLSSFEPWKVAQDGTFMDSMGMTYSGGSVDWIETFAHNPGFLLTAGANVNFTIIATPWFTWSESGSGSTAWSPALGFVESIDVISTWVLGGYNYEIRYSATGGYPQVPAHAGDRRGLSDGLPVDGPEPRKVCHAMIRFSAVGPRQAQGAGALAAWGIKGHSPGGNAVNPAVFGFPFDSTRERIAAQKAIATSGRTVAIDPAGLRLEGAPSGPYFISDVGDIHIRGSNIPRFDLYGFPSQKSALEFGVQTVPTEIRGVPASWDCPQ